MKEKFFVSCAAQSCFFAAPYIAKCKANQRFFFKAHLHDSENPTKSFPDRFQQFKGEKTAC